MGVLVLLELRTTLKGLDLLFDRMSVTFIAKRFRHQKYHHSISSVFLCPLYAPLGKLKFLHNSDQA